MNSRTRTTLLISGIIISATLAQTLPVLHTLAITATALIALYIGYLVTMALFIQNGVPDYY